LLAAAGLLALSLRQRGKVRVLAAALSGREALLAGLREAYMDLEATKPLCELGQSTAFINHEVKNYMMVISGYAALLQRSKSLTDKERAMVDNIAQSTAALQGFSRRVGELYKSNASHDETEAELTALVRSCVNNNFIEQSANISVDCAAEGGAILVDCSPNKLEKVFVNALRNSFEAGALNVSVKLTVHNYMALIVIEDDGAGCNAANLPILLKTFYTSKPGSMGLGLCVMRSIIAAHGGNISIYTKNVLGNSQHGMSVQIVLPASKKTSYTPPRAEALLVREDLSDIDMILGILKNLKIIPRVAETAKDLVAAPKNSSVELTVLASAKAAQALKKEIGGDEGIRIFSIEKTAGGLMLVKNAAAGSANLFTEEYVVRHFC